MCLCQQPVGWSPTQHITFRLLFIRCRNPVVALLSGKHNDVSTSDNQRADAPSNDPLNVVQMAIIRIRRSHFWHPNIVKDVREPCTITNLDTGVWQLRRVLDDKAVDTSVDCIILLLMSTKTIKSEITTLTERRTLYWQSCDHTWMIVSLMYTTTC